MRVHFSLRELLVSAVLVGAGVAALASMFRPKLEHAPLTEFQMALWFASGASIGAGLLARFQRPWLGAVVGLCVQFVLWLSMGVIWT